MIQAQCDCLFVTHAYRIHHTASRILFDMDTLCCSSIKHLTPYIHYTYVYKNEYQTQTFHPPSCPTTSEYFYLRAMFLPRQTRILSTADLFWKTFQLLAVKCMHVVLFRITLICRLRKFDYCFSNEPWTHLGQCVHIAQPN